MPPNPLPKPCLCAAQLLTLGIHCISLTGGEDLVGVMVAALRQISCAATILTSGKGRLGIG